MKILILKYLFESLYISIYMFNFVNATKKWPKSTFWYVSRKK